MGAFLVLLLVVAVTARDRARARAGVPAGRHAPRSRATGPEVAALRTDPAPGTSRYGLDRMRAFTLRLHDAYRAASAGIVTTEVAPLLVAHSALAVGWGRNVWNHNVGVIRAGRDWPGPWADVATIEYEGGRHVPHPRAAWRAYASLEDSAHDVLRLLSGSRRYARAWALLRAGDPRWFAAAGAAGWYTEPPGVHAPRYLRVLARVRSILGGQS